MKARPNASLQVDDTVLVKLIIHEIHDLARQQQSEGKEVGGWIIDGFPTTAQQAALLEKELTGYRNTCTWLS